MTQFFQIFCCFSFLDLTFLNILFPSLSSHKILFFDPLHISFPCFCLCHLCCSFYLFLSQIATFPLFQINDDTIIETPNWATKLVETLASNPSIPNFGVTGPSDSNNDKIFTHSFVHRTHIEVSQLSSIYKCYYSLQMISLDN